MNTCTHRPPIEPVPLVIMGGGGHAAVVADSVDRRWWQPMGYLADQASEHAPMASAESGPKPIPWLGTPLDLGRMLGTRLPASTMVHAAVGDGRLRRGWLETVPEDRWATVVSPSATVSASAVIEAGAFIGPHAVVNARAVVGRGTIVNSGAIVEHDCHVGAFVHLAPRVALGGAVHVGADTLIGIGAAVLPGVRLGRNAVLGAGAVAIDDLADGQTARGVPARAFSRDNASSMGGGI
ncbi:MAG: acetyltransferase [Phycisphaerales bacterium]|nr:acetyltransferase [Phycisphaerales bacterium]